MARPHLYAFLVFACFSSLVASAADEPLADAERLLLTGRYDEAVVAYKEQQKDHAIDATIGIARCYRATGKTAEATKALTEAIKAAPKNADLQAELARLKFESGDHAEAQKLVDAAVKANDNQLLARWLSAELHRVSGEMDEALAGYEWFIDYYNITDELSPNDLRLIGQAAAQYARWERNSQQFGYLINSMYPDALTEQEKYWPAHLESARLFMEKYNEPAAKSELDAALAINASAAEVHAVRAQLALQKFNLPTAKSAIERALEINPNLLLAHQQRADLQMADLQPAKAIETLEKAKKLNPVDEDTLGRLAAAFGAVDGLNDVKPDSRMAKVIDEAIQRNEHCGRFFMALGDSLDRMRKYPFAAKYYAEAKKRMPQLLYANGQLGQMYMRLGREAEATKLLDKSFEDDPFNVRIKNTLEVLDVLKGYAVLETDHFVIKFDRGKDEILAKYAARYLEEEVYPAMVEKLGYKPKDKSLFEIFNRAKNTSGHGWFSARMVGLPSIGTVGACAGQMVAMASPNDMPKKFNWARVLKHEFVHVVNLQQTHFNIPHWYTEALAVLNEDLPRPPAWNALISRRAKANTLFNLDTINLGFIRPGQRENWTLAYCQAELYAEFMLATYGDDALAKLLAAYADNLITRDAIKRSFNVTQEEFEKKYRAYVDDVVAGLKVGGPAKAPKPLAELEKAVKDNPKDADARADLAYAYVSRRKAADARKQAMAALKLKENHPLASYVLARVYLSIGDTTKALELLTTALDEADPQENVLALLAGLKLKAKQYDEAARLYTLGMDKYPHSDRWLKSLVRVYLTAGNDEKLPKLLEQLAELDYDNFTFCKKLAQLSIAKKDFVAAERWANQALHVDVMDAETHAMLAQILKWQEKYKAAAEEFEMAIRLNSSQLDWQFGLAEAYAESDQKDKAIKALKELMEKRADYPGAKDLLKKLEE